MKKKICLLLTFVVSLFVFSGRVEAARKMTCVYKGESYSPTMLVQDSKKNIYHYYINKVDEDVNSIHMLTWAPLNDRITYNYDSSCWDETDKSFICCPEWTTGVTDDQHTNEISFYDSSKNLFEWFEHPLRTDLSCYGCLPTFLNGGSVSGNFSNNQEEINNEKWLAKCAYSSTSGDLYIYFNKERLIFDNRRDYVDSSLLNFTHEDILIFYYSTEYCPTFIYELYSYEDGDDTILDVDYYLERPKHISDGSSQPEGVDGSITMVFDEIKRDDDKTIYYDENRDTSDDSEITSCESLLGDNIVDKINQVMDIIKIAIPILLIVFGIVDFMKIIFSGKDDDIAKGRKTFIMRIVAAILVFLSPILINLILNIANEVWSFINPNTCIR